MRPPRTLAADLFISYDNDQVLFAQIAGMDAIRPP